MKDCYGQHGWKQFHRNRKDILDEFDKIYEQLANRPIKTAHGEGVEAYLRKWLSDFLPKKYAVTSGYIIPDLYEENSTIYHYDIIIYKSLDAPILWTEGNYDNSEQGKFRAIPAKHVVAVYEVKSRLTKKSINDSVSKVKEVNSFKEQLPCNYHSGVVFIDLKHTEVNKTTFLEELHKGYEAHGFIGGMVLRYEGDTSSTGLISLRKIDGGTNNKSSLPLAKNIDDLNIYLTEAGDLTIAEAGGGTMCVYTGSSWSVSKLYTTNHTENDLMLDLSWSRSNFSEFCIRLINLLDGNYDPEKKSSFGQIFDKVEVQEATEQNQILNPSKPFIKLNIKKANVNDAPIVEYNDEQAIINFTATLENVGNSAVTISDDGFKSSIYLPVNQRAEKQCSVLAKPKKGKSMEHLKKELAEKKLVLPYRVVYYQGTTKENFIQVKRKIRISEDKVEVVF
ncbi:DUF6602 domain-containing protein [Vibrio diabolicus]|uniref:DUF6602 domain-containing protein n=1 Tax=Vibrio diabolicus TaxID=50719 RepID=UPI0029409FDF|nr:DUF6602 domain-containing protein [Vibrio diabolicus]MDV5047541.1 DUF6602 domain-containing protein [Vibrio diabolicus]